MKGISSEEDRIQGRATITMADPSYISKGVLAALAMVSGGRCYWPKPPCSVPVTVDVDGDMVLNVEIAHIQGAHRNGPRYVEDMTDEERRQFGNLLLLCPSHHRVIDVLRRDDFSIDDLVKWKKDREAGNYEILKQMTGIDEDKLQAVLAEAVKLQAKELEKQVSRFESAIAKLADIDSDAASLLAQRMKAAETLSRAAKMLLHTQDTSGMLFEAAQMLVGAEDIAEMFLETTARLSRLDEAAGQLTDAADLLGPLNQTASQLTDAAELLSPLTSPNGGLSTLTDSLTAAHDDLIAIDQALSRKIQELRRLMGDWPF
jgi:hypothetical protein